MSPLDPARLQRHLRDGLRRQMPASRAGPFTCYLHPRSRDASLNLGIPDEPTEGRRLPLMGEEARGVAVMPEDDVATGLVMLKAHFRAYHRLPRVEFVSECHPDLARLLEENGFQEERITPLLACTRETWRQLEAPAGLRVEPVLEATPWETSRQYLEVQREAFDISMDVPASEPRGYWPELHLGAGLLALVDGNAAAAGGITPNDDGLADVRGLGVREAYRGRGIASFLLSALARVGHETGVEALIAVPDDTRTAHLAKHAGFVRVGTLRAFTAEAAAAP